MAIPSSSPVNWSRVSTDRWPQSARILAKTFGQSSTDCSLSSYPMVAGTVRRRTARPAPRSIPRFACSSAGDRPAKSFPSVGNLVQPLLALPFPTWWHYDVLRGLEYLRNASVSPDNRVAEAIEFLKSKCDSDGRWPLETQYPGVMLVELDEAQRQPSRWNTLRALRVLNWYSSGT